jgi:Skp family chaperone for outer membrane proteins
VLKLLGYAVVLSLVLPSVTHAQTPAFASRLAYFSPQRAFAASPEGKLAQTRLEALQRQRAREIEGRSQQLAKLQATLQQSASALTDAARRLREQEIARFQVDLDRFIQDAQAEFAGVQRDFETAFLAKLRPALDGVARDRELLLVFNEDAGLIAWAEPSLDITAAVVARLTQP